MTANYNVHASDYLLSTRSLLHASKYLHSVLDDDVATVEFAKTGLERAAQQQESGGSDYRKFMFSDLETTTEEDKERRERVTEDVLASVLTDLQIANVLIAAGQVTGEARDRAQPQRLEEAILGLEDTTRTIERSLSKPLAQGTTPGRFGFAEVVSIPEVINSVDLSTAIETFRSYSNKTLTTLVNEAEGVVKSVIAALSKLDSARVIEALSNLGGQMPELAKKGGRLISRGIEILEKAIAALFNLLGFGGDAIAMIKSQLKKIWQDVKESDHVAESIKWAFKIEEVRAYVEGILHSEGLNREVLDNASKDLADLVIKFKDTMAMAKKIVAAIAFAFFLPIGGATLVLGMAFAYLVVLAAIILIGMDYTDSGIILRRMRGVREIASRVRPVQ